MQTLLARFRVGTRTIAGFAVVLALLVVLALTGLEGIGSINRSRIEATRMLQLAVELTAAESDFRDLRRLMASFVADGTDASLTRARDTAKRVGEELDRLATAMPDDTQRQAGAALRQSLADYVAGFETLVPLRQSRDTVLARETEAKGDTLEALLLKQLETAERASDSGNLNYAARSLIALGHQRAGTLRALANADHEKDKQLFKAAADMLNKSVEMVTLLPESGQGMKLILDYKKSLEAGSDAVTRYTALFGTELAAKAEAIGAEFDKLRTAVAAAVTVAEAEMDRTAAESRTMTLAIAAGALLDRRDDRGDAPPGRQRANGRDSRAQPARRDRRDGRGDAGLQRQCRRGRGDARRASGREGARGGSACDRAGRHGQQLRARRQGCGRRRVGGLGAARRAGRADGADRRGRLAPGDRDRRGDASGERERPGRVGVGRADGGQHRRGLGARRGGGEDRARGDAGNRADA